VRIVPKIYGELSFDMSDMFPLFGRCFGGMDSSRGPPNGPKSETG